MPFQPFSLQKRIRKHSGALTGEERSMFANLGQAAATQCARVSLPWNPYGFRFVRDSGGNPDWDVDSCSVLQSRSPERKYAVAPLFYVFEPQSGPLWKALKS